MSTKALLMIVGVIVFLAGLLKLRNNQSGGFSLRNLSINIGGKNTQANKVGDLTGGADKATSPDWTGLIIAALGLLTALVGWLKG